jgi:uncharacterized protein
MEYALISLTACLTAVLTLFSGFGLGTLLMPVFALFFPLPLAIAATALVHLANNLFKAGLMARHADRGVLLRFALPAVPAAFLGAALLEGMGDLPPLYTYALVGGEHQVTGIKLAIAGVVATFSVLELSPRFDALAFDRRWLPAGGLLSGFFGGLSGHQGALRSAFLNRAGLSKQTFVATAALSAVIVDLSRLLAYGVGFLGERFNQLTGQDGLGLLVVATLSAFIGSYFGKKLLRKVTLPALQKGVAGFLLLFSVALGAGLI